MIRWGPDATSDKLRRRARCTAGPGLYGAVVAAGLCGTSAISKIGIRFPTPMNFETIERDQCTYRRLLRFWRFGFFTLVFGVRTQPKS